MSIEKEQQYKRDELSEFEWSNINKKKTVIANELVESSSEDKEAGLVNDKVNEKDFTKVQLEDISELEKTDLFEDPNSSIKEKIWKLTPYALEGGHRVIKLFENVLDSAKKSIDFIIPGATSFVGGFVLPSHLERIITKTTEYGTKITTSFGKAFIEGGVNLFTLGAPAWIEAFRQHMAVSGGKEFLKDAESGKDVLSRSYLERIKDPSVKEGLSKYYGLRKELAEIRKSDPQNKEKIERIAIALASFEVNYKDNVDFNNLKSVFENGREFVRNNEAFVDQLATKTAEEMIADTENYYKDNVAEGSDVTKGKWLGIITSQEKGKEKLQQEIAKRLREIMSLEVSDKDVQKELAEVNSNMISAFGVYRKYFKAASFALLRLIPIPVRVEAGKSKSAFSELKEVVVEGWNKGFNQEKLSMLPEIPKISNFRFDNLNFFPTAEEYAALAGDVSKDSALRCAKIATHEVASGVADVRDWVIDRLSNVGAEIKKEISEGIKSKTADIKKEISKGIRKEGLRLKKATNRSDGIPTNLIYPGQIPPSWMRPRIEG